MLELLIKIFAFLLICGIGIFGIYAACQIDEIRDRWKRTGVDEHELRARLNKVLRIRP